MIVTVSDMGRKGGGKSPRIALLSALRQVVAMKRKERQNWD